MSEADLLKPIDHLWDAQATAAFLGVSRAWVYQRAEAGLLPHLKVGGLLRFEPDTLRAFMRKNRLSATVVLQRLEEAKLKKKYAKLTVG